MNYKHILLFFISSFLWSLNATAQKTTAQDTVQITSKYGVRVGLDLAKPLRSALSDDYSGFEVIADYRLSEKWYIAAEIGNDKKEYDEPNLNIITNGSYVKLGADYNSHKNWGNLNNALYTGLRYGFSTFSQELLAYDIYTNNQAFPAAQIETSQDFTGLTASWLELQVGIKTEIFNNLFLSLNVQLKRLVSEQVPENFGNVYIPGFNQTNDFSPYGVGYGYSISYLIPIYKK